MSALSKAKQYLIDKATFLYLDRRSELPFDEYEMHFKDLGSIICAIDQINTFSEVISDLETGKFQVIGYFPSDEDMIEDFLNSI